MYDRFALAPHVRCQRQNRREERKEKLYAQRARQLHDRHLEKKRKKLYTAAATTTQRRRQTNEWRTQTEQ